MKHEKPLLSKQVIGVDLKHSVLKSLKCAWEYVFPSARVSDWACKVNPSALMARAETNVFHAEPTLRQCLLKQNLFLVEYWHMLETKNKKNVPRLFKLCSLPPVRHVVLILEIILKSKDDILWFNGFPSPIKFLMQQPRSFVFFISKSFSHRTDANDFHTYDFNRQFLAADSAAKASSQFKVMYLNHSCSLLKYSHQDSHTKPWRTHYLMARLWRRFTDLGFSC